MDPRENARWMEMSEAEWRMRMLLALQGIDVSLEKIAEKSAPFVDPLTDPRGE